MAGNIPSTGYRDLEAFIEKCLKGERRRMSGDDQVWKIPGVRRPITVQHIRKDWRPAHVKNLIESQIGNTLENFVFFLENKRCPEPIVPKPPGS